MFTGIVQAQGIVREIVVNHSDQASDQTNDQSSEQSSAGQDKRFLIAANDLDFTEVALGDSICCNGVCLTATGFEESGGRRDAFWADVSAETLSCTTFDALEVGSLINLEKSLTPTTALGGHLVSGHVDGVGEVRQVTEDAQSYRFTLELPHALAKYVASKGSICIDGTSLTVNEVEQNQFGINIIPHTFENTIFKTYRAGSKVNIEIDLVARYVERLLSFSK